MANTGNTQQQIDYGAAANDGQGDPLRTAFIKTDDNFDAIWNTGPVGSNITILNNTIQSNNVNGNIVIRPNGVGVIQASASILPNTANLRDLGSTGQRWRAAYIGSGGLSVDGNVTVTGNLTAGNISYTGNVFVGDLQGSVYADDSTIMVDAVDNEMFASAVTFGRANVSGNITANYFIGNGSQLTGISSTYGNANVATYLASGFGTFGSNTIVANGNIVAFALDVADIQHQFPIEIRTNGGGPWEFAGNILRGPQGGTWDSDAATMYLGSPANGYIILESYFNSNVVSEIFMEHSFIRFLVDNGGPEKTWQMNLSGEFSVPGDIIPQSNGTASLGNATNYWSNLWVANNTIYIGGVPLGISAGNVLTVNGEAVLSNDSTSSITTTGTITAGNIVTNGISSDDSTFVTVQDGLNVAGDIEATGNITANYFLGNGSQLTGISAGTGNLDITGTMIEFAAGATEELITVSPDGFAGAAVLQLPRNTYANVYDTILTNTGGNVKITSGDGAITYDWMFDSNGDLTTPGDIDIGGRLTATGQLDLEAANNPNAYIQLNDTGDSLFGAAGNLSLLTDGDSQEFFFGIDGSLTAPGNITAVGYQTDGNSVTLGSGNTGLNQGINSVAIGYNAGNAQGFSAVAIGYNVGNAQGNGAVAIGNEAGFVAQGVAAVAIGAEAGSNAAGEGAVAVGYSAGYNNQATNTVAVGREAARNLNSANTQGEGAVAVGAFSGWANQGPNAVAIGYYAALSNQGISSIAIGAGAGTISGNTTQAIGNNSIILNATGANFAGTTANAFYVNPVRNDVSNIGNVVIYNPTSKEVTYANTISVSGNVTGANLITTGNIVGNVGGYEIGYRNIPQLVFAGDVQVAADDSGKHYYNGSNTSYTVSLVDSGAVTYPIGMAVTIVNRGTGNIAVEAFPGVSLYMAGSSSTGNRTVGAYGMATVLNVATDVWFINGTGVY